MKKEYKKPTIGLFPTKCHVSTLSSDEPEEMNTSRRSLLKRTGLLATAGHLTLLYGSDGGAKSAATTSSTINPWSGESTKK